DVVRSLALVYTEPLGCRDVAIALTSKTHFKRAVPRFNRNLDRVERGRTHRREPKESVDSPVHLLLQRNESATEPSPLGDCARTGVAKGPKSRAGVQHFRNRRRRLDFVDLRNHILDRTNEVKQGFLELVERWNRQLLQEIASVLEMSIPLCRRKACAVADFVP